MRMWYTQILALGLSIALMSGCGEPADKTAPVAPATAPAGDVHSTTIPVATQPAVSLIHINGRPAFFPRAKLKLETDGTHLLAILFSDDPPEAIKDNYTGNSFYLQLVLDVSTPEELSAATATYKARSSDAEDTPYGIYLNGRKIHLHPYDVRATFSPIANASCTVTLGGQFLLWNNADSTGLPQMVSLSADLPVAIEPQPQSEKNQ